MKPKIIIVDEDSKYLESVIKLGDNNRKRLGFFPKSAFEQSAKNQKILVAIDEHNDIFLGYLLYDVNKRSKNIYIVHFCIDFSYRRRGIAEYLFNELKNKTDNGFYKGIRVHCRRDYGIDDFWKKLAFHPRDEKRGRGKKDTCLTVWWYDYKTLSLLNDNDKLNTKQKVVLDANIFFDLEKDVTRNTIESQELLADWLQENIEFCLTNEIFDEINRKDSVSEREKARKAAHKYELIEQENQDVASQLRGFYANDELSDNDESDIKHLEHTIASGIHFFLTRDEALQKKADKIEDDFGVKVLAPARFITYLDELLNAKQYQPFRLEGKQISFDAVTDRYANQLTENFLMPQKEKKAEFNQILNIHLSDIRYSEVKILKNHDELLGLVIFCSIQQELEIPILRIKRNIDISSTTAQFLVSQILKYATDSNKNIIKISDKYIVEVEEFLFALDKHGFIHLGKEWYKINIYHVGNINSLQPHLDKVKSYYSDLSMFIEENVQKNLHFDEKNKNYLLSIENALYPAKITDINIPTFIVPIRPIWAMNLFDYQLGEQDVIGAKLNTLFSIENVYYCSSYRKVITAPSRVLWYVSKGDGKFQGTQSIRACSYIEEVYVDTPKNLFRKFNHLGIYEWRDIFTVAKNNIHQPIMAFKFTKTELFSNPLSKDAIQAVWSHFSTPQRPVSIPNDMFYKLYQLGLDKNL